MAEVKETNGTSGSPAATGTANGSAQKPAESKNTAKPRKSFTDRVKAGWAKTGLNTRVLLTMGKGGLPPVIALSLFQVTYISQLFPTLGYLLGIVAMLGFCIMPRAKFIETMFLDVLAVCVATAIGLLTSYSVVRARATTPSSDPRPGSSLGYNSSASVICAVWLFFQIYLVNTFRAKFPRFTFPTIMYNIVTIVTCSYAPAFPSMDYAITFSKSLLEVFLLGLGVATAVNLLVVPVSMRTVVFGEFTAYLGAMRGTLKAEMAYFTSLEDPEMVKKSLGGSEGVKIERTPQAQAVKKAVLGLQGLHGKIHGDLSYAKREFALFGYLGPDHLKQMYELCRKIILPLIGLSAVIDIFEHLNEMDILEKIPEDATYRPPPTLKDEIGEDNLRKLVIHDWSGYMQHLHGNLVAFFGLIDEGIEHVLLGLKLKKAPKLKKRSNAGDAPAKDDVEERAEDTRPGSQGFAEYFEKEANKFHSGKEVALRLWCERKGIHLPHDFFEHPATSFHDIFVDGKDESYASHQRRQRQLYLLLYMEYLINAVARSVLLFIKFADECHQKGVFARRRVIFPGKKRLKKWFTSIFRAHDGSNDEGHTGAGDVGGNTANVELGSAYNRRKNPEHSPPVTRLEHLGDYIRVIPAGLRSSESVFGLRVACATLSIALIAYLHQTQEWFVEQRGLWSLIMVAISMNPTAGASIFSYALRIFGTTLAMLVSWAIWYIPDQHTAGTLVFLWLFISIALYLPLKKPQFTIIAMISAVTLTMIIGYQLEARKVGIAEATSNNQPFYKILIFAPYRLATVIVGLVTAFIWTIFPYPISEHSQIRKGLGGSLYLLANYYSVIHELTRARIKGTSGNPLEKSSPGSQLEKHRTKIFSKLMLTLTGLRSYANFLKYEIPIGGKFPRKEYESIVSRTSSLLNFMSLVSYASLSFSTEEQENSQWSADFRAVLDSAIFTSREITTCLGLLSASILNGHPLPPHMRAPQPYQLSQRLESLDKDILSIRHINEPCYAAFAVIQISTRCIVGDINTLLHNVRAIVGELDFSFHVMSASDRDSDSELTLWETARSREANIDRTPARKED